MNVIHDRPEAKWLPSRYRFALAKLFAALMLARGARPGVRDESHLILAIDPDQSTLENCTVGSWYLLTIWCFITALLPLHPAIAVPVAFPLSLIAVEIPLYAVGLTVLPRWTNNRRIQSTSYLIVMFLACAYFATRPGWERYVAWFALGLFVVNALAAVLVRLLRQRIEELERRCAG